MPAKRPRKPVPTHKLCKRCGVVKPLDIEHFTTSKQRHVGGFYPYCRSCSRAKYRDWREKYPERRSIAERAYAARKRTGGGTLKPSDIREMLVLQAGLCAWCEQPYGPTWEVDHITPVCQGGTSDYANITISCRHCNARRNPGNTNQFDGRLTATGSHQGSGGAPSQPKKRKRQDPR